MTAVASEPDERTVRAAVTLASRAPSVHNTQPWRCRLRRGTLHLYADLTRWLPHTDRDGRDLVVSCGAMLDHLEIALSALGVATRVHRLPNPSQPDHLAAIELSPEARGRPVDVTRAIAGRRSDRRPFVAAPVPWVVLAQLADVAAERGALLRLLDPRGDEDVVGALLDQAALAREDDTGYQVELALWAGRAVSPDGVPRSNLLEATGPRWNRNRHFPRGDTLVPVGTAPDSATFVVVATTSDDTLSWLRAGEALSAVLLEATALGLSSCVVSQPVEVTTSRIRVRDELLGGTACPQLLVRLGWPQSSVALPETPRRPVDEVLTVSPAGRG